MNAETVKNQYFNWMASLAIPNAVKRSRYRYLLTSLDSAIFHFTIPLDENRYIDGLDLRHKFGDDRMIPQSTITMHLDNHECSMLEMMVALALRCQEHIIDDPEDNSQLSDLFQEMLQSLHLVEMTNDNFDERFVEYRIDCFLNHNYEPNGNGGLFTVSNPRQDMRTVEIWYQMCWYLDVMLGEI